MFQTFLQNRAKWILFIMCKDKYRDFQFFFKLYMLWKLEQRRDIRDWQGEISLIISCHVSPPPLPSYARRESAEPVSLGNMSQCSRNMHYDFCFMLFLSWHWPNNLPQAPVMLSTLLSYLYKSLAHPHSALRWSY